MTLCLDGNLRKVWAAQTISVSGLGMIQVALPLTTVLILRASLLYTTQDRAINPGIFGLILSISSVGSLAGSFSVTRYRMRRVIGSY